MAAISALTPAIRGLVFALIGLALGAGLGTVVTNMTDRPAAEPNMTIGYIFALIGWVLGVGLWQTWSREWLGLGPKEGPTDWKRYFSFCTDHKVIGVQYLVVAHFHYTMMGGEIFVIMAGLNYWFPKITGRMYNEALGKLHFWWMFVLYNATFIAMFWVGVQGMNRRVADYPEELADGNVLVSVLAFALGASFLVLTHNLVWSWIKGPVAEANPWLAITLEWQTSSPPPVENFEQPPVITGDPYGYGEPDTRHVRFGPAEAMGPGGGGGD